MRLHRVRSEPRLSSRDRVLTTFERPWLGSATGRGVDLWCSAAAQAMRLIRAPLPGAQASDGFEIDGKLKIAIPHYAAIFFVGSRSASRARRLRNDLDPRIRRLRAPIRGIETSARYGRGEL